MKTWTREEITAHVIAGARLPDIMERIAKELEEVIEARGTFYQVKASGEKAIEAKAFLEWVKEIWEEKATIYLDESPVYEGLPSAIAFTLRWEWKKEAGK